MFAITNYGYIFGHPQPTTFASLLINHHGCCEAIKNP
jgi:hypothetical protein